MRNFPNFNIKKYANYMRVLSFDNELNPIVID